MDVNHVASTYMGVGRGARGTWPPWILKIWAIKIVFCTNGVWPPLRPVSVAQNKPLTMLSSNVQSTDLLMHYTAWRFWTMRQLNDCSTLAPKSSAAKQWIEELSQKMKPVNTTRSLRSLRSLSLLRWLRLVDAKITKGS